VCGRDCCRVGGPHVRAPGAMTPPPSPRLPLGMTADEERWVSELHSARVGERATVRLLLEVSPPNGYCFKRMAETIMHRLRSVTATPHTHSHAQRVPFLSAASADEVALNDEGSCTSRSVLLLLSGCKLEARRKQVKWDCVHAESLLLAKV